MTFALTSLGNYNSEAAGTTETITLTSTPTAGCALVLFLDSSSSTAPTVVDSRGNTWVKAGTATGAGSSTLNVRGYVMQPGSGTNLASGDQVTITYGTTQTRRAGELFATSAQLDPSTPTDTFVSANSAAGSTAVSVTGSATPSSVGEVALCAVGWTSSATGITHGAGYTAASQLNGTATTGKNFAVAFGQPVTTAGTPTYTATLPASAQWVALIWTVKFVPPAIPVNSLTAGGASRGAGVTSQSVTVAQTVAAGSRCILVEHGSATPDVVSITTPHGEIGSVEVERVNTDGTSNGASRLIGFTTVAGLSVGDLIRVNYDSVNADTSIALYVPPGMARRLPVDLVAWGHSGPSGAQTTATVNIGSNATSSPDEIAVVVVQTMTGDTSIGAAPAGWTYLGYLDSYGAGQRNHHVFTATIATAGTVPFSVTIPLSEWTTTMVTYRKQAHEPTAKTLCSAWNGWPTRTSQTVMTRTLNVAAVQLQCSTDPAFAADVRTTAAVTPSPLWGYARVTMTGLSAATKYYFRTVLDGTPVTGRDGSFTTAPEVGAPTSFSWWQTSCVWSGDTQTQAFDRLQAEAPDWGVLNGDWHYGVRNYPTLDGVMTCSPESYLAGIEDQITLNPGLERELRSRPVLRSLSDHDSGKNDWSGAATAEQVPGVLWAFALTYPNQLPVTGSTEQHYSYGRVGYYLLDCRTSRDDNANPDGPTHTMLGLAQQARVLAWLQDGADQNKVIISDVPWNGTEPDASDPDFDKWDGYSAERTLLAAAFPPARVHVQGGDAHMGAYDDGSNSVGGVPTTQAAPLSNHTTPKLASSYQATWPTAPNGSHSQACGITSCDDDGSNTISYAWRFYSNAATDGSVTSGTPVIQRLAFNFERDADVYGGSVSLGDIPGVGGVWRVVRQFVATP